MNFLHRTFFYLCLLLLAAACTTPMEEPVSTLTTETFGTLPDGREVQLFTFTNPNGMTLKVMNHGATITSIQVPERSGAVSEVTLGFDNLQGYLGENPFFGNVVGRYGNRIGKGTFTLNDSTYTLATNNGLNHLHGGAEGFDKKLWEVVEVKEDETAPSVLLKYVSGDGEEGYPGTLTSLVRYTLTRENEVRIEYEATTDKPTVVNLTNHTYFNLKDAGATDILGHELQLEAEYYTPVDSGLIPTGELRPVANTPFDFRTPKPIGQDIEADHPQIQVGGGYDHNFVLDGAIAELRIGAEVHEPSTGRVMEMLTTQPGVQFYTGNFLSGLSGRGGTTYGPRAGFCLETQHYPDSPNQPDFPTTTLNPGETYEETTVYRFGVKE